MEVEKAIALSIKNIIKEGLTDIFDRPFEVDLLSKNPEFQKKIQDNTTTCIRSGSVLGLGISPIDYILMPKNTAFNFRKCALIQPHDTIKYLAIVLIIADTIEKARIPISQKRVFSYRFRPNEGYLFNKNYTITSFRSYVSERAKRKKVNLIVSCDIANYYERLNLHRLQNTLLSIDCNRNIVNLINELLLFWSNRDSYGLPVGSNASRILSEANLIRVDNYLLSIGVDFIRFVDDYRFFAPDASTAHYWLTILIDRLGQEGLSINMSKTKIEPSERYKNDIKNPNTNRKLKKDKNPFVIKAGYGGTVPTRFRALSNGEKDKLVSLDIMHSLSKADKDNLVDASEFINIIKACIAQQKYSLLLNMLPIIGKYLQLSPYYIDALTKCSEYFSDEEIEKIKHHFSEKLKSNRFLPEYLRISYIRLLGSKLFNDKTLLLECFRNLRRDSGAYVGRVLLDSLYELVGREDVLEIRKGFSRSDLWEKRQIIRIVNKSLLEEEKRPWIKNVHQLDSRELFLLEVAEPTKSTKLKKKKK
ncbi:RNA-directed DNA polymerase [Clostridium sp. MSTE9]|uniref:RNA-directed DNA polymerase n=1 Tax=Clostridium sp. (strain MSTE9) TaxID=1105031 RepID=UPI00026F2A3C|nr:RNA-directed DNA polymerase [Clostridium sp. MSTE9]EJF38251.1 RNA-directed DNA polymerase [Clostridium sp. MSTE9]